MKFVIFYKNQNKIYYPNILKYLHEEVIVMNNKKLRVLSLFSGIGAFEKAISNLNIDYELVAFSEIDKYSIQWRIEVDHNIYCGFKIHKDNRLVCSGDKTFDYLRKHLSGKPWQYGETWLAWKYPNDERFNFREFSSSEIFDLADDNLKLIDSSTITQQLATSV